VALVVLLYGQLLAGALMRHTEAGLAIPDFPLAYGRAIPSLDAAAIERYNSERRIRWGLPPVEARQVGIHFAHRAGSLAVLGMTFLAVGAVLRRFPGQRALVGPAAGLLGLVVLQMILGALTVLTGKQPHVATAHVAVGAAILGGALVLAIQTFRCVERAPARAQAPARREAAT
jgi:cytochrome c oxidase assembly protein subunit 15